MQLECHTSIIAQIPAGSDSRVFTVGLHQLQKLNTAQITTAIVVVDTVGLLQCWPKNMSNMDKTSVLNTDTC